MDFIFLSFASPISREFVITLTSIYILTHYYFLKFSLYWWESEREEKVKAQHFVLGIDAFGRGHPVATLSAASATVTIKCDIL